MYVRWKVKRLVNAMSPAKVHDSDGLIPYTVIQMRDGTTQKWRAGNGWVTDNKNRFGRSVPMEKRNIGHRGLKVRGQVPRVSYHLELVESKRVNGKPRQRVVAYLGSYQDEERDNISRRLQFWAILEQRLAVLDAPDRIKARVRLAAQERMARPTAAEVEQVRERNSLAYALDIKLIKELGLVVPPGKGNA